MKILYRLLVVILCVIIPIYFICFSLPFIVCGVIVNIFRYILVGKTYCLNAIFERHINKLFDLIDYCNSK
jgi:hypothetical protein